MSSEPPVVWLSDEEATRADLTGAKAAALASASSDGLPVIPGFVITTAATDDQDPDAPQLAADVKAAWSTLTEDGAIPLAVRSSSVAEDIGDTSMAGRFESVVGVGDWDGFVSAVGTVLRSRTALAEAGEDAGHAPLAVLVQRVVDAAVGGVMFSADPVTGDPDVVVVAAVEGDPEQLVSGEVEGATYRLSVDGDVSSVDAAPGGAELDAHDSGRLAALAQRSSEHFDGPQDMEWALDGDGKLWLLQSRPMTTAVGTPTGPLLGPGPVAETFPEALYPLEADLWVPPLRDAVREALLLTGTSSRRLDRSPVVTSLGGRVAVDLELFHAAPEKPTAWYRRLDPRPRLQRLRAAWRVGRLRAALPDLADDLIRRTDADLAAVPDFDELTARQLVALLHRACDALVALHGHEILVGLLVAEQPQMTGTQVALRILARARAEGLTDGEAVAAYPAVLALTPPRVADEWDLPPTDLPLGPIDEVRGQREALLREALRLRVRWVQELQARAAMTLGRLLVDGGTLPAPRLVRRLRLAELEEVVHSRAVPWEIHEHRRQPDPRALPSVFRMSTGGEVLPDRDSGSGDGQGAGGGRAQGPVHRYERGEDPPAGCVLVVRTLSPELAPHLADLQGLVAETGSVLAHVAILARESGLPTVVGVQGAYEDFADGDVVVVDGTAGTVAKAEDE